MGCECSRPEHGETHGFGGRVSNLSTSCRVTDWPPKQSAFTHKIKKRVDRIWALLNTWVCLSLIQVIFQERNLAQSDSLFQIVEKSWMLHWGSALPCVKVVSQLAWEPGESFDFDLRNLADSRVQKVRDCFCPVHFEGRSTFLVPYLFITVCLYFRSVGPKVPSTEGVARSLISLPFGLGARGIWRGKSRHSFCEPSRQHAE